MVNSNVIFIFFVSCSCLESSNFVKETDSQRPQWSCAPRGTVLSVLERARVQEQSLTNASSGNEFSDITLVNLAKRMDPESKKNETFKIDNTNETIPNVSNKPIISDLVVEDFEQTLKSQTLVLSDDFDLLEGLTTGHFDEKNKLVGIEKDKSKPEFNCFHLASSNCFNT